MDPPPTTTIIGKANKVLLTTLKTPVPPLAELPPVALYAVVSEWGYVFIEFRRAVTKGFALRLFGDPTAEVRRVRDEDRVRARAYCMQGSSVEYGEWRDKTRGRRALSQEDRSVVKAGRLARAREARQLQRIARDARRQAHAATALAMRAVARTARLARARRREPE